MSAIKNYMWDVGEYAVDHSIEESMKAYSESEEVVKVCIMFVHAFEGNWDSFVQEGYWNSTETEQPKTVLPDNHRFH